MKYALLHYSKTEQGRTNYFNQIIKYLLPVVILICLSIRSSSQADYNPIHREAIKWLEKFLADSKSQPLILDQSIAYPSAKVPKNFRPKTLKSISDWNRPLSNGDYMARVIFYCTQWCIHGPGKNVPYKLGRAKGKLSKPISALLCRGSLKKINRKELNSAAWKIQDGIKFENMNADNQDLIQRLIPDYKSQLSETPLDRLINAFYKFASPRFTLVLALSRVSPQYQKIARAFISIIAARQILENKLATPDDLTRDLSKLYETSSVDTENVGLNDSTSRWVRVNNNVEAKFSVQTGNLQDNTLEFRVSNATPKAPVTLHDLINGTGDDDNESLMAYPINSGAQIPIIEPDIDSTEFDLIAGTTPDQKTVTANYIISDTAATSVHFDVYRSATPDLEDLGDNNIKIGESNIADAAALSVGEHDNIPVLLNATLQPNTRLPYIVIVSQTDDEYDTAGFQEWLYGVIVHGFDRYAMPVTLNWLVCGNYSLPAWEVNMAQNLESIDHYDDVLQYNWMKDCADPNPTLATAHGADLAGIIQQYIEDVKNENSSDVVDVHLIGHSRGCVVVSECLKYLFSNSFSGDNSGFLNDTYIEVTFLDPHPANKYTGAYCSRLGEDCGNKQGITSVGQCQTPPDSKTTACLVPYEKQLLDLRNQYNKFGEEQKVISSMLANCYSHVNPGFCPSVLQLVSLAVPGAITSFAKDATDAFQAQANDPHLEIPDGVKSLDVWFQNTCVSQLCKNPDQEFIQNLWGWTKDNQLQKQGADLEITSTNLTRKLLANGLHIGHNEVPEAYIELVVNKGSLDRSRRY